MLRIPLPRPPPLPTPPTLYLRPSSFLPQSRPFSTSPHPYPAPLLPKPHLTRLSSPFTPHTAPRRRASQKPRRSHAEAEAQAEDGGGGGGFGESPDFNPAREPPDVYTHKVGSNNVLPEELRGHGFVFRKGLNVPRLNSNHWLNTMLLEPWIALKGNNLVWWDTNVRFTPLGFTMLHISSIIAAVAISWYMPTFFWADFEENMAHSQHLYMIDVAKLLWLQQAIRNCESVINQRKNGLIPGLLLEEALKSEKESPFRTVQYKLENDILERAEKWKNAQKNEDDKKKMFRKELWGDRSPSEINDELNAQERRRELYTRKFGGGDGGRNGGNGGNNNIEDKVTELFRRDDFVQKNIGNSGGNVVNFGNNLSPSNNITDNPTLARFQQPLTVDGLNSNNSGGNKAKGSSFRAKYVQPYLSVE